MFNVNINRLLVRIVISFLVLTSNRNDRTSSLVASFEKEQQQQECARDPNNWWWAWIDHPSCICSAAAFRSSIGQQQQQQQQQHSSSWWRSWFTSTPTTTTTTGTDPVNIVLCRNTYISLSSAIDISNRDVHIRCSQFLNRWNPMCTLDGNNATRIFTGSNAKLVVRNIHFINSNSDHQNNDDTNATTSTALVDGGAIRLIESTLHIERCVFMNNIANTGAGGAILMSGNYNNFNNDDDTNNNKYFSQLYITDTSFIHNHGNDGGALALRNIDQNITIVSSIFDHNSASIAAGAIIINRCTSVTISGTTFTNNYATSMYGGALSILYTRVRLTSATLFSNNSILDSQTNNNIYIFDDDHAGYGGSFVDCDNSTLFCHRSINGNNYINNDDNDDNNNNNMNSNQDLGIIENGIANNSSRNYYNSNCHLYGVISFVGDYNYNNRC